MESSDLELEVKQLKEKNNEMVLKVQFWKMKAAEQETEKLKLMKEINDLRLKVIRMRNGGAVQARALDSALQANSEEALSHLVQASSAVARTLELAKNYMKERQEIESTSSRWSNLSVTPGKEKVHKVAPTLMGGRTTQPFVSLRRVSLSNTTSNVISNQNTSDRVLPLPMHILQDVYIPLRRIDPNEYNMELADAEHQSDNEPEDLMLEDSTENADDSLNVLEDDNFDMTRQLEVLHEEIEESNEETEQVPVNRLDNPLEGPSWLLDNMQHSSPVLMKSAGNKRVTLEADSTTEPHEPPREPPVLAAELEAGSLQRHAFTPTVRRRRRTSSPPPAPLPATPPAHAAGPPDSIRSRNSARVLKVMVPKMRLEYLSGAGAGAGAGAGGGGDCSPGGPGGAGAGAGAGAARGCKRALVSLAPSPHGATDSAFLPLEQDRSAGEPSMVSPQSNSSTLSRERDAVSRERDAVSRERDNVSCERDNVSRERDSDSGGEGPSRVRRARKQVQYKEKPLNRKLRR